MVLAQLEITDSLQQGFDNFFAFLPRLIGFLIILLVGWIIARVVRTILTRVLQGVGLDRALHSGQTGQYVERFSPGASPSRLIAAIAYWFILLGTISLGLAQLGIPALTEFIAAIFSYLPNVIVAILIFVIAGVIAAGVSTLVNRTMGDTPTGRIVQTVVPVLVFGIAIFMILNQLRIAPVIVTITYAALIGAFALGLALAFGLGGRDVAARMLEGAYQTGRQQSDQVKQDMQVGKARGQQQAQDAKQRAQSEAEGGGRDRPDSGPGATRPSSYR